MNANALEILKCRGRVNGPLLPGKRSREASTKSESPPTTLSPDKKPQGRKCKLLDAGRMSRLRDAIETGHTIRNVCAVAGVSDKSYYRWLKEAEQAPNGHPLRDFRDTVDRVKALAEHRMLMIIQKAAQKNWRAAAWFLERRHSDRWGRMRPTPSTRRENRGGAL